MQFYLTAEEMCLAAVRLLQQQNRLVSDAHLTASLVTDVTGKDAIFTLSVEVASAPAAGPRPADVPVEAPHKEPT